jgi:LuxR family transcriptional regulator, maltose regulon positive regulatory protein
VLEALAQGARGETQKALAALEQALFFAEGQGYARIFLDEGQPMQTLLAQWLSHAKANRVAHPVAGSLRDYASRLLPHFNSGLHADTLIQENASPADNPVEPLTPREMDVLRLLAQGCSNRQIAEKLVLSEGTVKFYVHIIIEKLGARSRTQASLIARERNLV